MATRKKLKPQGGLVPTKDNQIIKETLRKFGKRNMTTYATETNLERSLPDLFDGLKPVQRRILWTMSQHTRNEFVKAARTVGDALGKYHPHGDTSVYGAMITMNHMPTQAIVGKGNWGNMIDGAAAYRYTNARLSNFGYSFFDSDYIHKEVTSFVPNYDDKDIEPVTLPAMLPYVLMTANEGVGVGITGKLPAFTAESIITVLERLLKGEKLQRIDFAKTLKYAHKWGGQLVRSPENRAQWLKMFSDSEANIKFESDVEVNNDKKLMVISDWPQGTNLEKFIIKIRGMKETLRCDVTGKSSIVTIVCKPAFNLTQFQMFVKKAQRATQQSVAVKMNVTVRKAQVKDGVVEYETKVEALSVPDLLMAWLKERIQLELRSLAYRVKKQQAAIAYSKLMIFACNKLDVIFKALRVADPDAFLVKNLKITDEQAKQILELRVRQLSKLDQDTLKNKLKEQEQSLKQLESWQKRPKAKVLSGLADVRALIQKDRDFKDTTSNQKLTVV
jgi:topoisomerase-4 subunit A